VPRACGAAAASIKFACFHQPFEAGQVVMQGLADRAAQERVQPFEVAHESEFGVNQPASLRALKLLEAAGARLACPLRFEKRSLKLGLAAFVDPARQRVFLGPSTKGILKTGSPCPGTPESWLMLLNNGCRFCKLRGLAQARHTSANERSMMGSQ
jgi:hypothetical protein